MDQELFEIIRKAKQGEKEAFGQLMVRFKGTVFRQAYAILNDPAEAEDIAQEAFLKVYYTLGKLGNEYAFASWLSRIVVHLCYDRIKKSKKEKEAFNRWRDEGRRNDSCRQGAIEHKQLQLNIAEAMQELSPEQRVVVTLRDVQGFTYDEIADIVQVPVGTVKSRIHTARKALKNLLSG
ncbi:RNA polymerase sigma-70 factor, ECF subfamily [Desulfotomaculum arcticum]|uniref:RNA polymerase sigma factor n=1 Tax=Desulfotruncus arcticus DSM 17038 TaxID=1121424 RepID=A0A1I2RMX2_9FIRM|nr:RNA polymerase sigma factor [Desulfotruncus arcticus]SFG39106.1 RNA polymerase sigma-70 factor, ECF subfamily [Desulfotomaculum arcticum] [Desulfotruncus arcticus DSM 17038]